MEPNQTNPSPENSGIPQGIPTGVFVPNNQTPVQNIPQQSVEQVQTVPVVDTTVVSAPASAPAAEAIPAPAKEGALDRIFTWLARFLAKISGQPDPITGAPNPAAQKLQQWSNIVGKVRGAANQAVEKASEVAWKAAATVNQATEKIQQVVPPPTASQPVPPVETPTQPVQPVQ